MQRLIYIVGRLHRRGSSAVVLQKTTSVHQHSVLQFADREHDARR
ncbi:hypothetical protein CPter91_1655 [Collimonas pratensis]|uniref:Uncharacterized protein n=1 Tax=Collimonas pratensis TaxID=279113 RepID=A0A127Q1W8_9BURK|nr:hypothetical protein CPter91_1655 [Collimonas pratensis]